MKLFKHLILGITFLLSGLSLTAQDIHFSQFYMSPLNLNPALTGVMNCNQRVVANYRNQWASVLKGDAFSTYSVSYDQRIPVGRYDYFGIGGTLWGDVAGSLDFQTLKAQISASYSKRLGGYRDKSHYLVAGVDAGIAQRSIDFLKAEWGQQGTGGVFDPGANSGEAGNWNRDNFIFGDFSVGMLWFSILNKDNNVYAGAAFSHLTQPDISFSEEPPANAFEEEARRYLSKYTVHAGGEFKMTDRIYLIPGAVLLFQGPSFEFNAGSSVRFNFGNSRIAEQTFQLGAWMRLANKASGALSSDAIIFSTRFDYDQFGIGFSYDINISDLKVASNSNGAFEFSLIYNFCGNEKRNVYCPKF